MPIRALNRSSVPRRRRSSENSAGMHTPSRIRPIWNSTAGSPGPDAKRRFETYFPPIDRHFSISAYSPKKGQFATVLPTSPHERRPRKPPQERRALRFCRQRRGRQSGSSIAPGQLSYVSPSVGKLLALRRRDRRPIDRSHPAGGSAADARIDLPRRLAHSKPVTTRTGQTYPMDLIRRTDRS